MRDAWRGLKTLAGLSKLKSDKSNMPTLVLFGAKENVVTDRVIDFIFLLAKYSIFNANCRGPHPLQKYLLKA